MSELGVWQPLSVQDVGELFASFSAPWWIAGGWAIDAFLGRESREHGDIDVGVLRRDQLAVRDHLGDWDVQAADPPGSLRPWVPGDILPDTTHDIWCRPNAEAAWGLQLMLDESDGDDWLYRRNPAVFRPSIRSPGSTRGYHTWRWRCSCYTRPAACRPGTRSTSPTACRPSKRRLDAGWRRRWGWLIRAIRG